MRIYDVVILAYHHHLNYVDVVRTFLIRVMQKLPFEGVRKVSISIIYESI